MDIKRKLLKLENYRSRIVYNIARRGRYRGDIPRLSNDRKSFEDLSLFLIEKVLNQYLDEKKGRFRKNPTLQSTMAGREEDLFEAAGRLFIGIGYYLSHNESGRLRRVSLSFFKYNCSPNSQFYWKGDISDRRLVENASIIIALLLNKEKLWDELHDEEKSLFLEYIHAASEKEFQHNNWLWFKVFHYLFLEKYAGIDCRKKIKTIIGEIHTFYKGDGWYNDGNEEQECQYDHYNSWAMHYYGLLFCLLAGEGYKDTKEILKKRFRLFKDSYLMCFNGKNLPLAWGRSLLYRFAVLSCFGLGLALGLIGEGELSKVKKITVSTINRFLDNGVLDPRGILTMGYTGPNVCFLESYSSDGSPYWALKAFSFLLLDKNHPFWKKDITSVPKAEGKKEALLKSPNLYVRNGNNHSMLINGGMNSRVFINKYNRFAYSNIFPMALDRKYMDNLFTLMHNGKCLSRDTIREIRSPHHNIMHFQWTNSTLEWLEAYATLIPIGSGYILINNFSSKKALKYIFSGFNMIADKASVFKIEDSIRLKYNKSVSELRVMSPVKGRMGCKSLPARSVLHQKKSVMPYFASRINPGKTRVIICAQAACGQNINAPIIEEQGGALIIKSRDSGFGELKLMEKDLFYE